MHKLDFNMGISLFCICISGCVLFLYCFLGERTTQNYLSFGELVYRSKWHRLPARLQKPIIMMIAVAQRPLYYNVFGIAHLNVSTFGKVNIEHVHVYSMYRQILDCFTFQWIFADAESCPELLHGIQNVCNEMKSDFIKEGN